MPIKQRKKPSDFLAYHESNVTPNPLAVRQPSVWERGAVPMSAMDPTAGPTGWYFPKDRLRQLENQYQTSPGRRPGGSGLTGLTAGDAQGWSRMLNEQQEFMNLAAAANKKAPPGVATAPLQERHMTSGIAPATGEANAPWSLGRQAMPESHESFMEREDPRRRKATAAAVAGLKGIR